LAQVFVSDSSKELVRQRREHTGTVARIGFAATSATVIHFAQHFIRIMNDLMTAFTFDVGDESDAATVFFICRIVQTLFLWKAVTHCSILESICLVFGVSRPLLWPVR
jgi:hypothetical protein